ERLVRADVAILRFGSGAGFARWSERLAGYVHEIQGAVGRMIWRGERAVRDRESRVAQSLPVRRLARYDEHLMQANERLLSLIRSALGHRRRLLETRLTAAAASHPKRVLERGYSITRAARTRRVIRSIEQIRDNTRVVTEVRDGEFHSTADDPRQSRLFD
ncbi:unnamed protein product, partial [marine sediment metagenome]